MRQPDFAEQCASHVSYSHQLAWKPCVIQGLAGTSAKPVLGSCNTCEKCMIVAELPGLMCDRSDAVPRLSYASVEGIFVELVRASPVRRAASDVKNR